MGCSEDDARWLQKRLKSFLDLPFPYRLLMHQFQMMETFDEQAMELYLSEPRLDDILKMVTVSASAGARVRRSLEDKRRAAASAGPTGDESATRVPGQSKARQKPVRVEDAELWSDSLKEGWLCGTGGLAGDKGHRSGVGGMGRGGVTGGGEAEKAEAWDGGWQWRCEPATGPGPYRRLELQLAGTDISSAQASPLTPCDHPEQGCSQSALCFVTRGRRAGTVSLGRLHDPVGCTLQRHPVLGAHDRLLWVKGVDELLQVNPAAGRRILNDGFWLVGRHYTRLVTKDIGTDTQVVFAALSSLSPSDKEHCFLDAPNPEFLRNLVADCWSLGEGGGTFAKYAHRPALFLSPAQSTSLKPSEIHYVDNVYGDAPSPALLPNNICTSSSSSSDSDMSSSSSSSTLRTSVCSGTHHSVSLLDLARDTELGSGHHRWEMGSDRPVMTDGNGLICAELARSLPCTTAARLPAPGQAQTEAMLRAVSASFAPSTTTPASQYGQGVEGLGGKTGDGGSASAAGEVGVNTCVQVRVYDPRVGAVIKGTFTPCTTLPPGVKLVVSRTQVKAPSLPVFLEALDRLHSNQPSADISTHINAAATAPVPASPAVKAVVSASTWMGNSDGPPAEPFTPDVELLDQLQKTQSAMMQDQLKLRFPIPDSVVLMGLPDPTGLIEEGCVAAFTNEAMGKAGGMEVLVYSQRFPAATRHSQIVRQFQQAPYIPPAPGGIPAGMIYSGSRVNLDQGPLLPAPPVSAAIAANNIDTQPALICDLPAAAGAQAADAVSRNVQLADSAGLSASQRAAASLSKEASDAIERRLTDYHEFCSKADLSMRVAYKLWETAACVFGADHSHAKTLSWLYTQALDAPRTGFYHTIMDPLQSKIQEPAWLKALRLGNCPQQLLATASSTCADERCRAPALFNARGEPQGKFCGSHKAAGMVNVLQRTCQDEGCFTKPHWNEAGATEARYCGDHKLPGMVKVGKEHRRPPNYSSSILAKLHQAAWQFQQEFESSSLERCSTLPAASQPPVMDRILQEAGRHVTAAQQTTQAPSSCSSSAPSSQPPSLHSGSEPTEAQQTAQQTSNSNSYRSPSHPLHSIPGPTPHSTQLESPIPTLHVPAYTTSHHTPDLAPHHSHTPPSLSPTSTGQPIQGSRQAVLAVDPNHVRLAEQLKARWEAEAAAVHLACGPEEHGSSGFTFPGRRQKEASRRQQIQLRTSLDLVADKLAREAGVIAHTLGIELGGAAEKWQMCLGSKPGSVCAHWSQQHANRRHESADVSHETGVAWFQTPVNTIHRSAGRVHGSAPTSQKRECALR
ncbi:MAG: hypothetical protein WDW38_000512 [Sanguina aurantia]